MVIIKEIETDAIAKIFAILYASLGLVFGAFVTLMSLLGAGIGGMGIHGDMMMGTAWMGTSWVGLTAIIILPIIYGIAGYLVGLVAGFLYNKTVGAKGIEVKTE